MKRQQEGIVTFINEGEWDRGIRIVFGVVFLAAGWSVAPGLVGIVLTAVGAVALITGTAGWCPAYTACRVSTRKISPGHCANCDAEPHP